MFCENCGKELKAGSRFCEYCGAPVTSAEPVQNSVPKTGTQTAGNSFQGMPSGPMQAPSGAGQNAGTRVTENVYFCPDGKYRWVYEFDMLRNPAILITVLKVMALAVAIVAAFVIVVSVVQGNPGMDPEEGKILVYVLLFLLFLIFVSYLIVAGINGWKYVVMFEMDEEGVTSAQMEKQVKKAQAMGWVSALAGLLTGNPTLAGAGMLAATRNSMHSSFASVRSLKANRGFHTIYVNELLGKNQVYAEDADFDFVLNFIKARTGK